MSNHPAPQEPTAPDRRRRPSRRTGLFAALALTATLATPALAGPQLSSVTAPVQDLTAPVTGALQGQFVAEETPTGLPWAKRITGYLPARDGLLLKYSVLLPAETGRFPTIMNYSGYDPGSIGGSAYQSGDSTMDPELDAKLLKAGYAVFGVNHAGSACSDGDYNLFDKRWGTDGADAIAWAAEQDWSDGTFGMANWSYAGLSQIQVAAEQPPALKAIAPGMSVTDPWRDVGFPGGVQNHLFPGTWWAFIQTRWNAAAESARDEGDTKCLANIARQVATAQTNSPFSDLLTKTHPAPATEDKLVWRRTNKIDIPVMSMVAWQDESTGSRTGYYLDSLDPDKTYLVGSNGQHDIYVSDRWQAHLIRFFDRFVKGAKNGFDKEPKIQLWQDSVPVDGDLRKLTPGTVITRDSLPVKVRPLRLSFGEGGSLTTEAPKDNSSPADSFTYGLRGPDVNGLAGATDWSTTAANPTGTLAYTTPALRETLTTYGAASADLWVSAPAVDADLQATITEVRPDGKEVYVQRGWLRLSERKLDPALSTPLRPFLEYSPETQQLASTTEPVLARLEVLPFSHTFRKGSSIRILLDTPSQTGGWDFAGRPAPTQIKVYRDADMPSSLVLGIAQTGGVSAAAPECGTANYQPCRTSTFPVPAGKGPDGSTAGKPIDR